MYNNWIKAANYENLYYQEKRFDKWTYRLTITIEENRQNSIKFYVGLSSGRKRRDLENYNPDALNRNNGIGPLLWVKSLILNIENDFSRKIERFKHAYVCIGWMDTKRKRVYSRMKKHGFWIYNDMGEHIYMKKIK